MIHEDIDELEISNATEINESDDCKIDKEQPTCTSAFPSQLYTEWKESAAARDINKRFDRLEKLQVENRCCQCNNDKPNHRKLQQLAVSEKRLPQNKSCSLLARELFEEKCLDMIKKHQKDLLPANVIAREENREWLQYFINENNLFGCRLCIAEWDKYKLAHRPVLAISGGYLSHSKSGNSKLINKHIEQHQPLLNALVAKESSKKPSKLRKLRKENKKKKVQFLR